MPLSPGARLGPYEIIEPIGAGGMGEVYRARDSRLGREVAIKVLPGHLSSSPEALARFQSEARAVAALSHPNILALHDVGTDDDRTYAVTELLEGETLRVALAEGPLPLRKAVEYARQIANGLAAAHSKGIVHRDLKPENLFLTTEGRVKILDFGLARWERGPAGQETQTPTMTRHTDPGTVLGSMGYMSPEQVRGEAVDARSDVFAYGAVLHEMLSGQRAFQRDTGAEAMTAILREDPPDLPETIPGSLRRVVHRCLEKKPEERFQSARDLAFAVDNALGATTTGSAAALDAPARRARTGIGVAAAIAIGLVGIGAGIAIDRWLRPVGAVEPMVIRTLTFSGYDGHPAASPDGRLVAFESTRDGRSQIWIKQLAGGAEAPLTEGEDTFPRFAPDGNSVLFIRTDESGPAAYRVPLVGGEPRKVLDGAVEVDASPADGRLAFVRAVRAESRRRISIDVADSQGTGEHELFASGEQALYGVRWTPDGRSIAVLATSLTGNRSLGSELLVVDTGSGDIRRFSPEDPTGPLSCFAWTGRGREVVLAMAGNLLGDQSGAASRVMQWDLDSGRQATLFWTQHLFPVLGGQYDAGRFTVAGPDRIIFDEQAVRQNLVEVPLGVAAAAQRIARGNSRDRQPAYSRDGRRVIFSSNRSGNLDLWMLDRESGAVRQLTDDPAQDWDPGFTADGRGIVWSSNRSGNLEIWTANVDGSGARQVSHDGVDAENPTTAGDGTWVLYWSSNVAAPGIWRVRPDGSDAAPVAPGTYVYSEQSPDGRHVAFLVLDVPNRRNVLRVVDVETGEILPFHIEIPFETGQTVVAWGRNRWTPDGRGIAWVGQDERGLSGIYVQDFDPVRDTSSTRRKLAGFTEDYAVESFDLSPDGDHLMLSTLEVSSSLQVATGAGDRR